jgi:hypothetical protein
MPIEEAFERWRKCSGSSQLAEQDLRRFVRSGVSSLEWRVYPNGEATHLVRSAEDSAEFWRGFADLSVATNIAGDDCLVVHFYRHPSEDDVRVSFFLRVADVEREQERLYPTPAASPPAVQKSSPVDSPSKSQTPTVRWVTGEARRLKAAGKIDESIQITDFAKLLEENMEKAAKTDKTLKPVKWQHIKNSLPAWGLWPVTSI